MTPSSQLSFSPLGAFCWLNHRLHTQIEHTRGRILPRLPTTSPRFAFPTRSKGIYYQFKQFKRSFYPVPCNAAGLICLRAPGIFSIRSRLRAFVAVTITKWQPHSPRPEKVSISLAGRSSPTLRALRQVCWRVCSCAVAHSGPNHRRTPRFAPAGGSCRGGSQSGAGASNSQPTGSLHDSRPSGPVQRQSIEYVPPSSATNTRWSPCPLMEHRWTPSP